MHTKYKKYASQSVSLIVLNIFSLVLFLFIFYGIHYEVYLTDVDM